MRGRKPKPTQLKLLTGNPGRRPINEREPKPRSAIPSCPKDLDADASKEWRRVVRELSAIGLLTLLDRSFLAAYCQCVADVAKLRAIVQRTGFVIHSKDGDAIPNPYAAALNRERKAMQAFGSEFGMSPASRTRLRADPPAVADDYEKFQDFINRGKKKA